MSRTIRQAIQENIVEDFELYKDIHKDFVNLIKSVNPDYQNEFTFNEFYIKLLNNFDGIDDNFDMTRKEYIKRIYEALTKLSKEVLNDNKEFLEYLDKIMIEEGFRL